MEIGAFLGWMVLGMAMCFPGAVAVAVAALVLRAVHPGIKLPRALLPAVTAGLALALWYGIPLVVHARFGGAPH